MRNKIFLLAASIFTVINLSAQTVQFPTTLTLSQNDRFRSYVAKIQNLPFFMDNVNSRPSHDGRFHNDIFFGLSLTSHIPRVCHDDFRYGMKFVNTVGAAVLGNLFILNWLPSNGNYLLIDCVVDNDMDSFREFLVTTTLSGQYIGHIMVRDGFATDKEVNFVQSKLLGDLTIQQAEIKMLSSSYTSPSAIKTFPGQKVHRSYKICTNGTFEMTSTSEDPQTTFNISQLKTSIF
jgi:hypothetical protein